MNNKTFATVGAVQAVLSLLVLVNVIELSVEALAAVGTAIGAVLTGIHAWLDPSIPFGNKGES